MTLNRLRETTFQLSYGSQGARSAWAGALVSVAADAARCAAVPLYTVKLASMRLQAASHWLAATLAAGALASPFVDIARTTVQADDSRAKLDSGIVSVRRSLSRTRPQLATWRCRSA